MNRRDLETLLLTLESTPALLSKAAAAFSDEGARRRPPSGGFSFVESVWHLADLEREGYAVRIGRLLAEEDPELANFDGDRIARERDYQSRDVEAGILLFSRARRRNIEVFQHLSSSDWSRSGRQEGVGRLSLADVPHMMTAHDRGHAEEISDLIGAIREGAPARERPKSAVA